MSTLQVANIHLDSTQNNRFQYLGSNNFALVAGGSTRMTVNSSAISTNGTAGSIPGGGGVGNTSGGLSGGRGEVRIWVIE